MTDTTPLPDLVIRSQRVLLPEGLAPACVHIRDGVIAEITAYESFVASGFSRTRTNPPKGGHHEDGHHEEPQHEETSHTVDAGDEVVMPGLVDTHVHLNEPGRTEWEGCATGTRAAAAGGVTTIVDMPLNSVPATTTVSAFERKLEAAHGQCTIDVGCWGGVVPGNDAELGPLWDAGVLGFKAFLVPSGVPEFGHVGEPELRRTLPILTARGAPLLVHAEVEAGLKAQRRDAASRRSYLEYLASRPEQAEELAMAMLIRLARELAARIHIVHVSSGGSVPLLNAARQEGLHVTAETCPHYLTFDADAIDKRPDRSLTLFKCAPPIRHRAHADRLWAALEAGILDLVASDHSPCPPEMKALETGDFTSAWGGIASLQLGLPIVWTLARARKTPLPQISRWMSAAPARLAGLDRRKGSIQPGLDADLVIFDPDAGLTVDRAMLHDRHKLTPYAGEWMQGVVRKTFVRGHLVYDGGEFPAEPVGQILRRGTR